MPECACNMEEDPLYLHQRFIEVENNLVNQQIMDLHEQIERLQRNNDLHSVAVRTLPEETESLFSKDIMMAPMPLRLMLPNSSMTRSETLQELDGVELDIKCFSMPILCHHPNWHCLTLV